MAIRVSKRLGWNDYFTFYSARHTSLTIALNSGVDRNTVSHLADHKNLSTLDHYAGRANDNNILNNKNTFSVNLLSPSCGFYNCVVVVAFMMIWLCSCVSCIHDVAFYCCVVTFIVVLWRLCLCETSRHFRFQLYFSDNLFSSNLFTYTPYINKVVTTFATNVTLHL